MINLSGMALRRVIAQCAWVLALVTLHACDSSNSTVQEARLAQETTGNTLHILAGSELKDIAAMAGEIKAKTGVQLNFEYSGTLDAAEKIASGENYDAVWVSHGKYLQMTPGATERLKQTEKIMLSPVVLGLKESIANKLGWCGNAEVTWKDIATAAEAGKFTFGMTNPASSNSGFTALVGLTAALSGKSDALTLADVQANKTATFFKAQRLTAGSSGWLSDAYLSDQTTVDGIINYESVLLSLNQNKALKEKLCLIYPNEGIITADYPLMLLSDTKKAAFNTLVAYLRGEEFQQRIMAQTLRRPVNSNVKLSDVFPKALLIELPFPGQIDIVNVLLEQFQNSVRIPAHSWFVLDTSGSMGTNDGIEQLRKSIAGLSGEDNSVSGRFAHFLTREHIEFITFAHEVNAPVHFAMAATESESKVTRKRILEFSRNLNAEGGTAIYDAVHSAYKLALVAQKKESANYYQTIVLMTDGRNTDGNDFKSFQEWYTRLPEDSKKIRVFTVAFGDADTAELNSLAKLTGGKFFDGRKGDLRQIFKEVRGYQ